MAQVSPFPSIMTLFPLLTPLRLSQRVLLRKIPKLLSLCQSACLLFPQFVYLPPSTEVGNV